MAQALSTLALGTKLEIQVKSEWQHKFGARIIFMVVDKNHAGYPSGAISLMTEKALMNAAYDAKEPTNPNSDRAMSGNSRYIHSNIHQWLNSSAASAWYSAKHTYDAPPIAENVVNGVNSYASWPGFLNMLNEQFGITLMSTSLQAARPDIDGGGVDSFSAKMFLPSISEMGYAPYMTTADGTLLSYFNTNERRAYPIPETGASGFVNTYTRSARAAGYAWGIDSRAIVGGEYSGKQAYGFSYHRPMCNLPGTTMVMPSPYTSGMYILVENPPTAPTINYPIAGKTTYNKRPRALITLNAASSSGLTQTLIVDGFTPSSATGKSGQKKRLIKSADAQGNTTVSLQTKTQYSAPSTVVSRTFVCAEPVFTDNPIISGGTKIKAAHMNELRVMINNVRAYYGLGAKVWAEAIEAGTTSTRKWAAHVEEMRNAIGDIVTLVNGWDTSAALRIVLPAWIPISTGRPRADVMEQIRAAVQLL